MRESRTYGSGRGACDETHVPTATGLDGSPARETPLMLPAQHSDEVMQ